MDWDAAYREHGHIFGDKPSPLVEKASEHAKRGKALVIGAGYGRNALYLARKGFKVTALDPSRTALSDLTKTAKAEGLSSNAVQCTVQDFAWKEDYDLIVAVSVLHILTAKELQETLNKAKQHTRQGGIHALSVFNSKVFPKQKNVTTLSELIAMYRDWTLLHQETRKGKLAKPSPGFPNTAIIAEVIAQKP